MKFIPKLLASVLFAGSAALASAATYNELFVFGDSLSDPGNAYYLTGNNAALWASTGHPLDAQGHFSNGPTAAEYLANALGINPTKGWAVGGGNNFAVGGALTGAGNILGGLVAPLSNTGVASQVAKFTPGPGFNASTTLFMVQGGGNDFLQTFDYMAAHPGLSAAGTTALINNLINTASSNMADNIYQLGLKGATNILWTDMPDLGLIPETALKGPSFQFLASQLSAAFNAALAAKIAVADASLDAIMGYNVNVFGFSESAFLQAAAASQPLNLLAPCVTVPGALPSCTGMFFYDSVHPTTATHALLAQQLLAAAVPEPEMWLLMMVGVGIVGLRARRKA